MNESQTHFIIFDIRGSTARGYCGLEALGAITSLPFSSFQGIPYGEDYMLPNCDKSTNPTFVASCTKHFVSFQKILSHCLAYFV